MNLSMILQLFGGEDGIFKHLVRSITDRIKEGAVDTDVQAAAARLVTLPQDKVDSLCRWAGFDPTADAASIHEIEQLASQAGAMYGQVIEKLAAKKLGLTVPAQP